MLTREIDWGKSMPRKEHTNFEYKDLGDGISYVAINTFGTIEVVDEFKKYLDRICDSKGLIIDVRENGGGNSENGDRIVSLLIDKPILNSPWKTPQHIAAFQAWGRPKKWHTGEVEYVEPCEEVERFRGPIVALMGPESFSAAEDFLVLLHSSKRATLVGSKTGGSTGQPLRFEFDYGVNGRICTKRNTYPDGREFVGIGIIPDVEFHVTQKSIAEGEDIVLHKGVEVLKDKMAETACATHSTPLRAGKFHTLRGLFLETFFPSTSFASLIQWLSPAEYLNPKQIRNSNYQNIK